MPLYRVNVRAPLEARYRCNTQFSLTARTPEGALSTARSLMVAHVGDSHRIAIQADDVEVADWALIPDNKESK